MGRSQNVKAENSARLHLIRWDGSRKHEGKEKEIDQLETHRSRSPHRGGGWVRFSTTATVWAAIHDADRPGMDPGIFYH
jgi:hypothetical protein